MPLIIPQEGEIDALSSFIASVLSSAKLHLFVTNLTLGPSTTLAALLAAEATFTGYSPFVTTTWSAPVIDGTGRASTTCTQPTFTGTASGGTGNLYGYFYTNGLDTKLYGCQTFGSGPLSSPQNIAFAFDVMYTFLSQA